MTEPLIEFRNVHKTLGSTYVLRGTNLQIPKGQITTIIGKSGTGKSVFFKHVIGLLKPDAGDIICDGKPMSEMTRSELWEWRGKFSYMFQNMALFDSMTVYENIALPLDQGTTLSADEIRAKVRERLQQLDIENIEHKYPSELSGGMQKRVAMARALITNPEIILFDEPNTGRSVFDQRIIKLQPHDHAGEKPHQGDNIHGFGTDDIDLLHNRTELIATENEEESSDQENGRGPQIVHHTDHPPAQRFEQAA